MKREVKAVVMTAIALLAALGPLIAQQQLTLTAVPPPSVQGANTAVSGTAGNASACYWVVVNYAGGGVLPTRATCRSNVPNTLSVSNYVIITWQAAAGAVSYDVLKTALNALPTPGASVALATGLTTLTTNDQGGMLSAYTATAYPYANAKTTIILNNRDYSVPQIQFSGGFPINLTPANGVGNTFNVEVLYDKNGKNWLTPTAAANAVNGFVVANAAAGAGPTISPGGTGSDTNIDFFAVPKGTGSLKLGNITTPYTIDSTGSALNTVYSVSVTASIAQVNAGLTFLTGVTGRTVKVQHVALQAIGGAVATCDDVRISDTNGTPVDVFSVLVAALTQNTVVTENNSGMDFTLGTFAPTGLTANAGLQIRKTGASCATATSVRAVVFYTLNS